MQEKDGGIAVRLLLPINGNRKYTDLCHQYPDNLGYIIGPSYYQHPRHGIAFALDNDAFKCWKEQRQFDVEAWREMLDKVDRKGAVPLWCVVPDVVCNRDETLRNWEKYNHVVLSFGWQRAFVLQDGMAIGDVPDSEVYFVGGSTHFKWTTAHEWCIRLPRVHVGRVRTKRLSHCERIGAESCDGSGWLRDTVNGRPFRIMEAWLNPMHVQTEIMFA